MVQIDHILWYKLALVARYFERVARYFELILCSGLSQGCP